MKGNPPCRTLAVHLVVHFVWKKKWPDVRLYTYSWAVAIGLAGWSGNWKERDWKIDDKELWGRDTWIYFLNEQKCEGICVHVISHQRVTSAEENFNNQVDKVTCSVETSQYLSLATSVINQWAREQSCHGSKDGGYMWAQQHGLLLTKPDLAMAIVECPICQQ